MAISIQRGKYRVVVSLSPDEMKEIRRLAYQREETVNETLRKVTLSVARGVRKDE